MASNKSMVSGRINYAFWKRLRYCLGAGLFKQLTVGERFRWASEIEWPLSSAKSGVLVKTGPRTWRYEADGQEGKVGSINAVIVRVNATGGVERCGEYVPYLGD